MTTSQKLQNLFSSYLKLWGLYILFFIAMGVLHIFYPEIDTAAYKQTSLNELLENNPLKFVILACVFAPIVEEMMFRTLIKPSHKDLILFICSWPVFLLIRFLPNDIHWLIQLAFSAVLLFTTFYIVSQLLPETKLSPVIQKLHRYTPLVLIVSSLIFGLVHINNYVDDFVINTALLLLIVPRIISGCMMGLLKMKNQHLIWPIGLHFLNNAFVVGISLYMTS